MKWRLFVSGILLLSGLFCLIIPYHIGMTGLVLVLLGLAVLASALLRRCDGEWTETCRGLLAVLASVGVIVLMAAMNIITTSGEPDWETAREADYAIVLGAAVNGDGKASRIMRSRLSAAMTFLEKNPEAMVILSGGQGEDEPSSEAQCMYDTLLDMGADPQRLLREDQSFTTRENLSNSMEIIGRRGGTEKPIALITSEFHQRRARFLADSLDIKSCPVPAKTDQWFYRVNYTLREVFAFVKAYLQMVDILPGNAYNSE